MSIRVLGVLQTPMSQVVQNVPIKVVTSSGFGNVLTTSEAIYFTDNQGNYDFNLAFGTHELYVMFTDTFEHIGTTVANDSLTDSSYTISELLYYTTPLPNQNEQCIRDDFGGCISALETAWDTCIVQLSQQVVQGDTGVCTAMTTYTNDRLQACSAELTDTIVAGDAAVLLESQAYADATGAEITCCTTSLNTALVDICSTLTAYTTSNDIAIACLCTDMDAGDAQVLQTAEAYSDTCAGIVCSNLVNMVQACDAAVYTCMNVIDNGQGLQQAGYEIVTQAGDACASIALVATACTEAAVQESCILMQADKIIMHNGNPNTQSYPFQVVGNCVYMDAAYIRCLTGDKLVSNTTIKAGTGITTAGMNGDDSGSETSNLNKGYRFWAGYWDARNSTGIPTAPFRVTDNGALIASNAYITGCINTTCLVFCDASAVPPEITNAQLTADSAVSNLLNTNLWVVGYRGDSDNNACNTFIRNGDSDENYVSTTSGGPFGQGGLVWRTKTNSNTADTPDGGWTYCATQNFSVSKSYLHAVWACQTTLDGQIFFGTTRYVGMNSADGTQTSDNPYFWSGDLPQLNKWYLLVGVVHARGYTAGETGVTGVYDPDTGTKVASGVDWVMPPSGTVTNVTQRVFWYYSADVNGPIQYFYKPGLWEMGNAPSVQELMGKSYDRALTAETNACNKAVSACNCGISCGDAAKTCAVNEGTAACAWTENRIYPCQSQIQIKSGNYVVGSTGWAIDCSGNAEFNNAIVRGTISAATGCFCGSIYAQCIIGDVTSGLNKAATTQVKSGSTGNTPLFAVICVSGSMPYPRTLQLSALISVWATSTGEAGNPTQASAKLVTTSTQFTAVNTAKIWACSQSGNTHQCVVTGIHQVAINIPANTTGSINIYGHLDDLNGAANGGMCIASPYSNNTISAILFRNGNDLC
ncbi:tail family protein [Vibrio virus vB_VspP_SBP1]|uniref:Tail family protein n=1 Tax=Vibrio virus vB_VspP_SBP1 TaxID=2500581 RepID=A0A3T0IIR5_9CAUD|nr:tail family protein [Vibrio virus vB_VspP_SBP1]AZU99654.1 tail family protein [Vibrio virus vB_VspP_SBP1]